MISKKLITVLVVMAVLSTFWLLGNPPGRFGWCCYAYSTYGSCPRPISDFQVRADGSTRKVPKTHQLSFEQIKWLLDQRLYAQPEAPWDFRMDQLIRVH